MSDLYLVRLCFENIGSLNNEKNIFIKTANKIIKKMSLPFKYAGYISMSNKITNKLEPVFQYVLMNHEDGINISEKDIKKIEEIISENKLKEYHIHVIKSYSNGINEVLI